MKQLQTYTDDVIFDQILEHIIKQNNDLSKMKRFRRFRLQKLRSELDDDEELTGFQKFMKRVGSGFRKMMPKAFQKLQKLENQSK